MFAEFDDALKTFGQAEPRKCGNTALDLSLTVGGNSDPWSLPLIIIARLGRTPAFTIPSDLAPCKPLLRRQ